jgi:hypothetical protein
VPTTVPTDALEYTNAELSEMLLGGTMGVSVWCTVTTTVCVVQQNPSGPPLSAVTLMERAQVSEVSRKTEARVMTSLPLSPVRSKGPLPPFRVKVVLAPGGAEPSTALNKPTVEPTVMLSHIQDGLMLTLVGADNVGPTK